MISKSTYSKLIRNLSVNHAHHKKKVAILLAGSGKMDGR